MDLPPACQSGGSPVQDPGSTASWPEPARGQPGTGPTSDDCPVQQAYSHEEDGDEALSQEELARLVWHPGLSPKGAFLAFSGERAVGLGVASAELPGPGPGPRRGAVELLAVRPGYQHRGIGRALLHAALSWLADRHVTDIRANVDRPKPLAILQRYGFVPVPADEQET